MAKKTNRFGMDIKSAVKRRRKKSPSFDPNREYVQNAVEEFLKNGGKIKKLVLDDKSYENFMGLRSDGLQEVEEFLKS